MTKDEALAELASATDIANSWARELGILEAHNEFELHRVLDRIWAKTSADYFNLRQELEELRGVGQ